MPCDCHHPPKSGKAFSSFARWSSIPRCSHASIVVRHRPRTEGGHLLGERAWRF
jgi:hypothetical protein